MNSNGKKKTLWKDIGDLRKPNSTWRLRGAASWWASDMLEQLELGLTPVKTYEVDHAFFKEFEG